jgi:hypothetical protein
MMNKIWKWGKKHIEPRYFFTPFGITRTVYSNRGIIGYTDVYLFGIRVARIQSTKPWN